MWRKGALISYKDANQLAPMIERPAMLKVKPGNRRGMNPPNNALLGGSNGSENWRLTK
jgi:hypothetical protein